MMPQAMCYVIQVYLDCHYKSTSIYAAVFIDMRFSITKSESPIIERIKRSHYMQGLLYAIYIEFLVTLMFYRTIITYLMW